MKGLTLKSLVILSLLFTSSSFAVNIKNFTVTPDGNKYLEFSWEKLANSDIDQETHYGLQWSKNQSDVRIDEPTTARTSMSQGKFRMRGDMVFEKDKDYYSRVYGFYRGEMQRKNFLTKGSKILKFKWLHNGNIETSIIEPNDPTIVADNATTTVAKTFQKLSAISYDTSVQVNWSKTNDLFDEYVLVLGTDFDLATPLKEVSITKNYNKALLTGLESGKKYYITGYLKRNGQTYGKGETISFTTLAKFTADKQRRFQKYVLDKKRYGKLIQVGETTEAVVATVESSTTTPVIPTSDSEIKKRISALKKLISKYQTELRTLEAKTKKTSSTTKKTSSSLLSRLKNWRSRR